MCALCEGATSLSSGLPCSEQLTRFGQFLQQMMGEGPAYAMAMQAIGWSFPQTEQAREVYGGLTYGIYRGRAEEIQRERKQHQRDRLYAAGLTFLGVAFGWGIAQIQTALI